jgi:hypothetical protein
MGIYGWVVCGCIWVYVGICGYMWVYVVNMGEYG